jgi:HJR/Mrr/RecB family endonuclease
VAEIFKHQIISSESLRDGTLKIENLTICKNIIAKFKMKIKIILTTIFISLLTWVQGQSNSQQLYNIILEEAMLNRHYEIHNHFIILNSFNQLQSKRAVTKR